MIAISGFQPDFQNPNPRIAMYIIQWLNSVGTAFHHLEFLIKSNIAAYWLSQNGE